MTNSGPYLGEAPTGRTFERRGCSVAELEDRRIVRYRGDFDRATLLRQLGLLHLIS